MTVNHAAVLYAPLDLRVEQRPIPDPAPREVVVEIRSVGVCGSDVHWYEDGRIGDRVVNRPLVLGHESAGVVVARGEMAIRHRIGQRVAVEPGVPCGQCWECRHGRYNLCPDVEFFGTPGVDGAFARYVAIHEDFAHPLPDDLTDDAGALMEPLSVGIWANRRAGTTVGSRVLVTGAGPIGILAAQVAKAAGAAHVTVMDINPDRLAVAAQLGADSTVDARDEVALHASEPGILIECTGAAAAVRAGIGALRPAGTAVLVGMGPDSEQPLPVRRVQQLELSITGVFRYANTYPQAIALATAGRVRLEELVGARLPLEETEQALRMGRTNPSVLKTVVRP